ncbi:MFS transporter [Amphibacillus cookii]|uniref:MFS transporter n=1 Tax=Amphibacillus cookii TaxID=767787 RepID=UPI00195C3038|nr:MFS transporter [Amphibacillus cookii]MBM7542109.1 MFS family permease [Amphibacillus cookii]
MFTNQARFWVLISFIMVSGFVQGMLLPLLAIILEQSGVSSSVNGLHATGLYIGILVASPFMEKPLQKFGYKPLILFGGAMVFSALTLFPLWQNIWFWFVLRFIIGIGDHMLSFATQTWLTSTTTQKNRGRTIAIYGLFFSLGFSIGPLMSQLVSIHEHIPFITAALLCFVVWLMVWFVRNDYVTEDGTSVTVQLAVTSTLGRFIKTTKIAWIALLAPFTYGILEALLHSTFPIYGLRIGHGIERISLIIPTFSVATLLTQVPLGALSDRVGRDRVLPAVTGLGAIIFLLSAQFDGYFFGLTITFAIAGMLLGSLFSMGVSYMADLLPRALLPAGNIMCGITFSIGSMIGPYLGGLFINYFPKLSFFYIIVVVLFIITFLFAIKKQHALIKEKNI